MTKHIITDPAVLTSLSAKISAWVTAQASGVRAKNAALPVITAVEEYPVYRVILRMRTETRTAGPFSRADKTPVQAPATLTAISERELWELPGEQVAGFINYRYSIDVPGSCTASSCKACSGAGTVQCPECLGKKGMWCSDCHGDGKMICPSCKRTLAVPCKKCGGHGKVYKEHAQRYEPCAACNGKGDVPCDTCVKGMVVCQSCHGSGRIPCVRCGEQGVIPCTACEGKGQFISGISVEVIHHSAECSREAGSDAVPEQVWKKAAQESAWEPVMQVPGPASAPAALSAQGLPSTLLPLIEEMRAETRLPPETRIAEALLSVEKKTVYRLLYRSGETEKNAWMYSAGSQAVIEPHFLADVYANVINDIRAALAAGNMASALAEAESLASAGILRSEAGGLVGEIRRKTASAYAVGAGAAVLVALGIGMPLLSHWRGTSFHYYVLVIVACCGIVLSAAVAAGMLYSFRVSWLRTRMRQRLGAAGASLVVIACCASILMLSGADPARSLDMKAAQAEYKTWFPFGLRTLSTAEDIRFLRALIEKYKPTGIDLSSFQKDLAWLENKQQEDIINMKRLQNTAQKIESRARKPAPRPVRRARSRIYVK